MIMLRDDPVIEVFDTAENPPSWIEAIDIENGEYQFCDDKGQQYVGKVVHGIMKFGQPEFHLKPDGLPDIQNLYRLLDRAKDIEPNARFPNLESLRKHFEAISGGKMNSTQQEAGDYSPKR